MTAQPLSNALAKVRALLPLRIVSKGADGVNVLDRNGKIFCRVPNDGETTAARAALIRDAMNEMQ